VPPATRKTLLCAPLAERRLKLVSWSWICDEQHNGLSHRLMHQEFSSAVFFVELCLILSRMNNRLANANTPV
jgi:hypothetical protein